MFNSKFLTFNYSIVVLVIGALLLSGCKATYPKEQLLPSIVTLCKKETGYDVTPSVKGKTLYTVLHLSNQVNTQLSLSKETIDIIQNVMLSVNRVALSTNAAIDFFVVIIIDDVSKVSIVFTQYVPDLRRWILGSISRDDFYARSLTDISMFGKGSIIDPQELEELTIPAFIARQVAFRVKQAMGQDMVVQIMLNVERIDSAYRDGIFEYTIQRITKSHPLDAKKLTITQKNFDLLKLMQDTHRAVCEKYKFTNYKKAIIKTDDGIVQKIIK